MFGVLRIDEEVKGETDPLDRHTDMSEVDSKCTELEANALARLIMFINAVHISQNSKKEYIQKYNL